MRCVAIGLSIARHGRAQQGCAIRIAAGMRAVDKGGTAIAWNQPVETPEP